MGKSKPDEPELSPPSASKQIIFHQLLVAARKTWLSEALSNSLKTINPKVLRKEVVEYVPSDALRILGEAGIRDELVFPTPVILSTTPTLVGYYRLLLGASQKLFYASGTGFSRFKRMETSGTMSQEQQRLLPAFCRAMCMSLAELVRQISPTIMKQDVIELPLLTLGAQFYGANNNTIGQQATADVFLIIADLVERHMTDHQQRKIVIKNAAGRSVTISLASDPDVRVQEEFEGKLRNKVAIEIKGGTDRSNAHNRAGEAEKSHQKARNQDFRDFWTLIAKRGLDLKRLREESPTTTSWFDVAQVLARRGSDWEEFRSRFADAVGIPVHASGHKSGDPGR